MKPERERIALVLGYSFVMIGSVAAALLAHDGNLGVGDFRFDVAGVLMATMGGIWMLIDPRQGLDLAFVALFVLAVPLTPFGVMPTLSPVIAVILGVGLVLAARRSSQIRERSTVFET